jgi:HEAT repeat protein
VKNPAAICRTVLFLLIALCAPPSTVPALAAESSRTRELIQELQSPDLQHRVHAANAARWTKPLPLAVVPALLNCFRDLNEKPGPGHLIVPAGPVWGDYSKYLVRALTNAGTQAIPQLSLALNDHDEAVRKGALDALLLIVRDSPTNWPVLINALGNTYDDVARALEKGIPSAVGTPIVPLLLRSLDDPNPRIRGGSAVALAYALSRCGFVQRTSEGKVPETAASWKDWVGPAPDDIVLDLARALNSIDPDARAGTLDGLSGIGPGAIGAIPYVLPMLKNPDWKMRLSAVNSLENMGPAAKAAVPGLVQTLNDPNHSVRVRAIEVLGEWGAVAEDAVPGLDAALKSPDNDISEQAALALVKIDPRHKGILPGVMRAFSDAGETNEAIDALGEMGSNAQPAVPALDHLLAADDSAYDRKAAATALARIEGANAVPTLVHLMNYEKDEDVQTTAAAALAELAANNAPAVAALVAAFSNESEPVREAASNQLA